METELLRQRLPLWMEHVRKHLARRVGSGRMAADCAQEAGLRLLSALADGVQLREPRAWLFRVAQNLAVDEIRRRSPQPLGLEWQAALPDTRAEERDEPVYRLAGREMARGEVLELLPYAMSGLTARDRGWLLGYYHAGCSCERMAKEHDVSLDASKVRLHRARRRLAQLLQRAARRRAAETATRIRSGAGAACAAVLAACSPSGRDSQLAPQAWSVAESGLTAPDVKIARGLPEASDATAQMALARGLRAVASGKRGPERIRGLEDAASAYARVAERWPDDAPAAAESAFRRGEILRGLERDGEAYGAFLEALDAADAAAEEIWSVRARLELGHAQRRAGRTGLAVSWYEQAAARSQAPLRQRNDAREALAEVRLALMQWEEAAAAAAAWRADAESTAEEARAALLEARALNGAGRAREAVAVLDLTLARLRVLALEPVPEAEDAARAVEEVARARAGIVD